MLKQAFEYLDYYSFYHYSDTKIGNQLFVAA